MQKDFHYYATYCAAILAGYTHQESMDICYSAQFVDECSETLLKKLKAPRAAATTQLQLELMDSNTDPVGLQKITRIWSSFHFLPGNLYSYPPRHCSKKYRNKYRLICDVNSDLLLETVELAKGSSLQAVGIAMHVLADTWAHRYFAGTPSLVINNTNYHFYELLDSGGGEGYDKRPVKFRHSPSADDDLEKGIYTNSVYQTSENAIMNLGHGRAGHLPDYSFIRYKYLPAWADYEESTKDNPSDYMHAFCQMVYAMKYLRGLKPSFKKDVYDAKAMRQCGSEIKAILTKRQLDACAEWKALGQKLSGQVIEDFDIEKYQDEYVKAGVDEKFETFLGRFNLAAMAQKSMVTNKIFRSGNRLAGISIDYNARGFKGIKDYRNLLASIEQESKK